MAGRMVHWAADGIVYEGLLIQVVADGTFYGIVVDGDRFFAVPLTKLIDGPFR